MRLKNVKIVKSLDFKIDNFAKNAVFCLKSGETFFQIDLKNFYGSDGSNMGIEKVSSILYFATLKKLCSYDKYKKIFLRKTPPPKTRVLEELVHLCWIFDLTHVGKFGILPQNFFFKSI